MDELNEMQTPSTPMEETVNTTLTTEESAKTNHEVEETVLPAAAVKETSTPAAEMPTDEPNVDYTGRSREQLIEDLKVLLEEDVESIKERVQNLRNTFMSANKEMMNAAFEAFIAGGGNKDEYQPQEDHVAETFHKLYKQYQQRRQQRQEEIEAKRQKNLLDKQQILEELKALIESEEPNKKIRDDYNALQERWKSIGDVPRDNVNDLWQNYHFLLEQFFSKMRINNELMMLDLKKNLEKKIAICEKAEEMIVEPNHQKAFNTLQNLRDEWKSIGPVPREQNEEIWKRFCTAADQISARFREHNESRREEMEKNLVTKQALLAKAKEFSEEIPTSTKIWNEISSKMDELLAIWKTIGPVPREQNETIWKDFKGTIDNFYTKKKAYFDQLKDEQNDNYNVKVELCLKAEAIAKREDWKKATEELLQLQKEWKEAGPVNRKLSDKIWQRFRNACDEFFAKKGEYFSSMRSGEAENLSKKEALIAEIRDFVGTEDRDANMAALKDFQRRWVEIGFVPMKKKEAINKEYHTTLDAQFEKLRISAREAEETAYREKIKNAAGDAKRFVNNEKNELLDKIEKLRVDLKTWENNLGFFATSKQADLLKNEFEKKMQNARQQIALLEAKLRILREAENQE